MGSRRTGCGTWRKSGPRCSSGSTVRRRYLVVIKSVLYEIAEDDRAVVIGRGGQWLLRDVLPMPPFVG
jgi:hypothetical protein